ncbi:MAG TPA: AI-2E family transporter [Caldilineae bacterium]|nr:AI-2E family transporter [Caldilineae bacterium]HIQ11249.1 AI-2E family transporter [Caldilineales bacterium]
MTNATPRWSLETKRWAIFGIIVVSTVLVYYARSALSWLVVAALLAYLLQPLVNWLHDHKTPRALAAILAIFLALGLLLVIPAVLFPLLLSQFTTLFHDMMNATLRGLDLLDLWLQNSRVIRLWGFEFDMTDLLLELEQGLNLSEEGVILPSPDVLLNAIQQAITTATGLLGSLSGFLTALVSRMVSLMFSIFLMIFYIFYITVDGHRLKPWAKSLVKPEYLPEISELGHRINRVWQAFFRGQLMLSLVIGALTLMVGLIIGLPSALALAIIAGIMEAVPTIGPIIAAVPAVILALAQGSSVLPVSNVTFAFITLGVYIVIQQLENALIVPRIMGSALELHPMIVLVGVVIGAKFAGILGIFLAAPTLATLKVIFQYAHAKILDLDPFPIPFEEEQARLAQTRGPTLRERWYRWKQRASLLSQHAPEDEASSVEGHDSFRNKT